MGRRIPDENSEQSETIMTSDAAKKKVLIVDDDPNLIRALSIRCEQLGLTVQSSSDGLHALMYMLKEPPDLAIFDVNMPGADGLFVGEMLARDQRLSPVPVIFLTGRSDEETVRRCKELGAHYIYKGIDAWDHIRPLISQVLGHHDDVKTDAAPPTETSASPKILVVDDDLHILKAIKIRLRAYGVEVLLAPSAIQGYWTALKGRPDVIITDYTMPNGYGNYLINRLQNCSLTKDIPVIVLTGRTVEFKKDHSLERNVLRLGAARFLTKPLDFDELLAELRKHVDLPPKPTTPAPQGQSARQNRQDQPSEIKQAQPMS